MRNLNEHNVTDAVVRQLEGTPDARLKTVLTSLVRHLHGFVREVELTEAEWFAAVQFLTALGRSDEYILASDVLGATILVDAINHRKSAGATESSVLGPFYRDGARLLPPPADIAGATPGEAVVVQGRVTRPDGRPVPGALLDVWQTAPNGLYENQDPDQPDMNLRGTLCTDADGRYAFRTVKPVSYSIPHDGPVGQLLRATGRHPYRPAHIHFKLSAPGYEPLTTMLFVEGDPYLDSDAVFGVKSSLVTDFVRHDTPARIAGFDFQPPFWTVDYDFGLQPVEG
jgi:protocatechuate 3,4-dioxygenase beta subunit